MEEEDTVSYQICPTNALPDASEDRKTLLTDLRTEVLALVGPHVVSYLWNCERFTVNLSPCLSRLEGSVTYKDNVEDEWIVIALIRLVSVQLGDRVACRVTDADGEILLIEAADVLPSWAQEPDNSEGRAWIFKGDVHLIPRARKPSELTPLAGGDGAPLPGIAARVVAAYPEVTLASESVQKCVNERLGDYPTAWSAHAHVAHARLPRDAAALLQQHPQLLAQAVHHVTSRDAKDGKLLRNMTRFPEQPEASVTVAFTFTKHLYALVASEKLLPYKKSGWSLPPASDEIFRARSLGFILCAGLEILASRAEKRCSSVDSSETCDLSEAQVNKLNALGYFRDFLPGSKDFKALYETAKSFFKDSDGETENTKQSWDYLAEMKSALTEMSSTNFVEGIPLVPESDDSWLNVDQASFDAMLGGHFKLGAEGGNKEIPDMFKSFLQGTSDMKGVENEDELEPEADLDKPLEVTGDSLRKAFENLLKLDEDRGGESSSSDEDDDYGDEEEYMKDMEAELKRSNVFQENNKDMDENLIENLMSSVRGQENMTGPASTLLQSVMKK